MSSVLLSAAPLCELKRPIWAGVFRTPKGRSCTKLKCLFVKFLASRRTTSAPGKPDPGRHFSNIKSLGSSKTLGEPSGQLSGAGPIWAQKTAFKCDSVSTNVMRSRRVCRTAGQHKTKEPPVGAPEKPDLGWHFSNIKRAKLYKTKALGCQASCFLRHRFAA